MRSLDSAHIWPKLKSIWNSARVRVLKVTAAHDVGRAINPTLIEGQIEGGVAQGLGMALMEEFFPGKGENLHDYLIPIGWRRSANRIDSDRRSLARRPVWRKGIGEQAVIPTAPAILNALHDAIGIRVHESARHSRPRTRRYPCGAA